MNLNVTQVSSLEKIRPCGMGDVKKVFRKTIMGGETFSYQIAIEAADNTEFKVQVISPLKDFVKLYAVKNIAVDYTTRPFADDDYITKEPCLMPDLLMPMELEKDLVRLAGEAGAIWVTVEVPENTQAGEYPITISLSASTAHEELEIKQTLILDVIAANVSKQQTIYSQWVHVDCIADAHNVPIYSEEHWTLIDKYMALASSLGITMLLTPIITPPLDTEVGSTRPCTQLVKIEKKDEKYIFDFSLLKRWISLCKKNSIKYFEMSHLFSQWGVKYAPNIKVTENGKESYMFGWHVSAQSDEYKDFLYQFLPALIDFFKKEGIKDRCWFHISDEPKKEHIANYKYAFDMIKPLIDDCPTLDALSNYEFYEQGLVQRPVTATSHIEPFLENRVKNQWAYYYCAQHTKVGNRFLAMPSYRNRILGLQLYKYNIEGFLHWGFNFYYNQLSRKKINPYISASADRAFPAGDAFSVYPIIDAAVPSLRALVFKEALNDIEVCRTLESYIGHDKVVEMIDEAAGMNVTFSEYPRNSRYIPELIEKMEQLIKEHTK